MKNFNVLFLLFATMHPITSSANLIVDVESSEDCINFLKFDNRSAIPDFIGKIF